MAQRDGGFHEVSLSYHHSTHKLPYKTWEIVLWSLQGSLLLFQVSQDGVE